MPTPTENTDQPAPPAATHPGYTEAKAAIKSLLHAIHADHRKYYLIGEGTQSWETLCLAASAIWGLPAAQIKNDFRPRGYDAYLAKREREAWMVEYCDARQIQPPAPNQES